MRGSVTFNEFANTFIPFALLLVAAMWGAEATYDLTHFRLISSIWVSFVFVIPALYLFVQPDPSPRSSAYWLLCWTFSFLAYLPHFYLAVFRVYHGSLAAMYMKQGPLIATSNLAVTALWTVDVALAWLTDRNAGSIKVERVAAHTLVALTFFVSGVVIFGGVTRILGLVLTAAIGLGLMRRFGQRAAEAT
jgi:hypothetical protein